MDFGRNFLSPGVEGMSESAPNCPDPSAVSAFESGEEEAHSYGEQSSD